MYSEMNIMTLAQAPPLFNIVGLLAMLDRGHPVGAERSIRSRHRKPQHEETNFYKC